MQYTVAFMALSPDRLVETDTAKGEKRQAIFPVLPQEADSLLEAYKIAHNYAKLPVTQRVAEMFLGNMTTSPDSRLVGIGVMYPDNTLDLTKVFSPVAKATAPEVHAVAAKPPLQLVHSAKKPKGAAVAEPAVIALKA